MLKQGLEGLHFWMMVMRAWNPGDYDSEKSKKMVSVLSSSIIFPLPRRGASEKVGK